jgi:formate dehydrogenase subunit gamma
MSKMSNKYNKGQRMIRRFGAIPRIYHWLYVASFLVLLLTGLPKIFVGGEVNFFYAVFGGAAGAHLVHRIAAVILMLAFPFSLALDWKGMKTWLRELVDWRKRDFAFIAVFPKEFFGLHVEFPPQGYLNGGTKINSILQIVCCMGFSVSGLAIWFPTVLPHGLQLWMYPMHITFVCLSSAVVMGHIYLAALHPNAKGGLQGIITGYVPEFYAREHHGAWLDELIEENQTLPADKKLIKSWDLEKGKVV